MSSLKIHNMAQGTAEWFAVRKGIPTASNFSKILAKGNGLTRASYMKFLTGEIITGEPGETFTSEEMKRGHAMEPDARALYAFVTDSQPELVGFITNGPKGGSPDALIGNDGLLEIKTNKPTVLCELLDADEFPSEYIAQCQGNLWVAEREWIDIICYWPKMPALIKRAYRDTHFIRQLADEVELFNEDLAAYVVKMRSKGTAPMKEAA
jgi:hypothetical protein